MKIALIGTVASSLIGFRGELIALLRDRGHQIYAFASDFDERSMDAVRALGAFPIRYEMARSSLNIFADVLNTVRLAVALRKIAPDVVFSYFAKPVIFGTFAGVLARVSRCIGMIEGLGYAFTVPDGGISMRQAVIKRGQVLLYATALPCLDHVVFLNRQDPIDLVQKYRIKTKKTTSLGGIGVNLQKFQPSPAVVSPVTFLFVGRLIAEKGIYQFLDAACAVKAKYPNSLFIVVGDVDAQSNSSVKKHELAAHVASGLIVAPGHVDDVAQWIAKSSVFVLPSYYREGVPMCIQEAMACGRAIITTDMPGCRDTVSDGVNGFLVSPFRVDELISKMCYFIENVSSISTMGNESRKLAIGRFDRNAANKKLISIIEGV